MTDTARKKPASNRMVGIGWCGLYHDNSLGWNLSQFIHSSRPSILIPDQMECLKEFSNSWSPGDMYRVKVTIELVRDKRGKLIVKHTKGKR